MLAKTLFQANVKSRRYAIAVTLSILLCAGVATCRQTALASPGETGSSCCSRAQTELTSASSTTPTTCSAVPAANASERSSGSSATDNSDVQEARMQPRIESAQSIIDDVTKLKGSIQLFHEHAVELIAQSKRLQGEAQLLQTRTPVLPSAAKLSGAQLQSALKQYNADLANFTQHAGAYDQHLKTFQATVGECHANQQALDSVIKKYEIHADQFHVPTLPATIRPPHICKRMLAQMGDMSHEINSMMMDQKRVMEAQIELAKTEATLQNAEAETASTHAKAINQSQREDGEQALAAEFGRLKDEYDLLKIEKDQISGNNQVGKVTRSSVSAKVKKN